MNEPAGMEHAVVPFSGGGDLAERKQVPANLEAEQLLLAGLFQRNTLYDQISDRLQPEHFADELHANIYTTARRLFDAGQAANAVSVYHAMGGAQRLGAEDANFRAYLADLQAHPVAALYAKQWADLVIDCWRRREILHLAQNVDEQARDLDGTTAEEVGERLVSGLLDLQDGDAGAQGLRHSSHDINEALAHIEAAYKADGALVGVTTGLSDLNHHLGGLHGSDLVVIAARPGMGKTALARGIARAAAGDGKRVAFFSAEMSGAQLSLRDIAERSGITVQQMRSGRLTPLDWNTVTEAAHELGALPIETDQTSRTASQVRVQCRRAHRRHGLDLVIADYLQLLSGGKAENRVQEISNITRDLKRLAKELNVPVVALSQLSREVEKRDDKRPQLADLRESGAIEQDADVVIFLYREYYYLSHARPEKRERESEEDYQARLSKWNDRCTRCMNTAEVIIAKNRHGPASAFNVHFDSKRMAFSDRHEGAEALW